MRIVSAQIKIWIPGQSFVAQGKVCEFEGKMAYLAEMSERKWFRNYSGYAIAKRLLDVFAKLKFNPVILYYRPDLNTYYTTTRSKFTASGILVNYGGHSQYVLPIHNWKAIEGQPVVPTNFPSLSITEWVKKCEVVSKPKARPVVEDVSIPNDVRHKMRELFYQKYPEMRRANG